MKTPEQIRAEIEANRPDWQKVPAVQLQEGDETPQWQRINTLTTSALRSLRVALKLSFDAIWRPQKPQTTEEMLAALGTNAAGLFDRHAMGVQLLLASGVELPPDEYTPPKEYVRHDDGTITLK